DDLARWEREATDRPAGRRSRTPLVAALVLLLGVGAALGVGWQRAGARRGQAEAAARRALAHARAGDPDAADREVRIARELDPHCLEANAAEAYLRLLGREWTRARELTDHTLARDPESFTALAVRACARWRLGDAEGAAQDVERALALAPH